MRNPRAGEIAISQRGKAVSDLQLSDPGRRLEDLYDAIADGVVVGRIMMLTPLGRATVGVDRWI
jgi:hypothetical protein